MSADDHGRDVSDALVAELEALLARARGATSELERADRDTFEPEPRTLHAAGEPVPETRVQEYANELAELCRRVLEEADEKTATAFWRFLVDTAARHGRRADGWAP